MDPSLLFERVAKARGKIESHLSGKKRACASMKGVEEELYHEREGATMGVNVFKGELTDPRPSGPPAGWTQAACRRRSSGQVGSPPRGSSGAGGLPWPHDELPPGGSRSPRSWCSPDHWLRLEVISFRPQALG